MNHGLGDIKILKFRKIDLSKTDLKWDYLASSLNRNYGNYEQFGVQYYKNIEDMARDIMRIADSDEKIKLVDGKPEILINPDVAVQYSRLDNDEKLELTKKIMYLRAENKLEGVVG